MGNKQEKYNPTMLKEHQFNAIEECIDMWHAGRLNNAELGKMITDISKLEKAPS